MANLVEYVKTVWENGKTALNAARMNNMEQGISNCATQINKLGDSVCQKSIIWYSNKASVDMTGKQIVIGLCSIGSSTVVNTFFIWYSSSKIVSTSKLPDGMTCDVSGTVISFTYTDEQSWVFLTV